MHDTELHVHTTRRSLLLQPGGKCAIPPRQINFADDSIVEAEAPTNMRADASLGENEVLKARCEELSTKIPVKTLLWQKQRLTVL